MQKAQAKISMIIPCLCCALLNAMNEMLLCYVVHQMSRLNDCYWREATSRSRRRMPVRALSPSDCSSLLPSGSLQPASQRSWSCPCSKLILSLQFEPGKSEQYSKVINDKKFILPFMSILKVNRALLKQLRDQANGQCRKHKAAVRICLGTLQEA